MVLLQHKLNVKLSQRQILTPGLVQMVSVLALNKLELKDMINAEMVENPVMEEIEKPSFENFLSKPGNLSDHLLWQLGAISVRPTVHQAAELIIGNLNEEGYLIASDEELLGIAPVATPEADVEVAAKIVGEAEALGLAVDADALETSDLESTDLEAALLSPEDIAGANGNLS